MRNCLHERTFLMCRWWAPLGASLVIVCIFNAWPVNCSNFERAKAQHTLDLLASLGLDKVEQYRVPVHVNLIFIGFDSKLQHSASLSTDVLKRLLEHNDGDESFVFKYSYFLSDEFLTAGHSPDKSHVVDDILVDLQTQVVELSPLTHMALEAALTAFVRLENKADGSTYQLDADKMGSLFESLLHATNLSDYYTLFVINPDRKVVVPGHRYGYRTGFSAAEIHQLHQEQLTDRPVSGPLREDEIVDDFPQDHDPDHEAEPLQRSSARKFQSLRSREIKDASDKWASKFLILNRDVITARAKALKSGIPAEQCGRSETIVLKDDNDVADAHGADGHAHGEGHRINVQYNISAVQMARHIRQSGSDSEKQYLDMVLNKGPEVVRENCMADIWQSRGRYAWIDLGAGPFKRTSPSSFASTVNTGERLPRPDAHLHGQQRERADIISYWTSFCRSRSDAAMTIAESDLCDEIHALKVDPLLGNVGVDNRHAHEGAAGPEKSMKIFQQHLKVSVQDALRHLLVRPIGFFPSIYRLHTLQDNPHIRFEFYITADHNSFRPTDISEGGIDLLSFKHEMRKFALPSQNFSFHIVHLEPGDVDSLWQSVHQSVMDVKEMAGSQYGRVNASNLALKVGQWMQSKREHKPGVYPVPIFLFSVARSVPLLFDGASQAVATDHSIVVFQSHHHKFPSGFSCNDQPVYHSLRNPLKAVLSAAVMYLSGLLPDHYSSPQYAEGYVRSDYLWSVGDSPFSVTSHKAHFTALHRDLAHRQTVIATAQQTLDFLYEGLDTLADIQEKMSLKKFSENRRWIEAAKHHNKALQRIRKGLAQVSNMDFIAAVKTTGRALQYAGDFRDSVKTFVTPEGVFKAASKGRRMPAWFGPVVVFITLALVGAAAFCYWRSTNPSYRYSLPTYKNR